MVDVMGYRAKLGFVSASTNSVATPDLAPLCPPGASVQFSDFAAGGGPEAASRAIARLADRRPQIMGLLHDGELVGDFADDKPLERNDIPLVPPSEAFQAAGRVTGWTTRVGLISPFRADASARARSRLGELGFEIVEEVALDLEDGGSSAHSTFVDLRRSYGRLMDRGVEHVVQLGHNLPLGKLVPNLEEEFGIPILSANRVCFWRMLRRIGIEDLVPDAGRLFSIY